MYKSHRKIDDFFEMHPNLIDKKEELIKEYAVFDGFQTF